MRSSKEQRGVLHACQVANSGSTAFLGCFGCKLGTKTCGSCSEQDTQ